MTTMEQQLARHLNSLYGGVITSIVPDLLYDTLRIDFFVCENEVKTEHFLIFHRLASFYYIKNIGPSRFNFPEPESENALALALIIYYPDLDGVGEINIKSSKGFTENMYSSANFCLDMDAQSMLIEAGAVTVDGVYYEVGFPELERDKEYIL